MRTVFLTKSLREIDHAIKASGRRMRAYIKNETSPIPQLFIFDENIGAGPILMCLISDDGFIPLVSFSDRLPVEVQRPFGMRKLRAMIYAMPKQDENGSLPIDSADVVQSLRDFWRRHQRL